MRVVIDTNALLKVFARRGELLKFKKLVNKQRFQSVTSAYILAELERGLPKFGHTKYRAKIAARLLQKLSIIHNPKHIAQVSRDPNDDPILALALEAGARYIVTFDKDLLILDTYENIRILQLDEFYELFDS
jgi:putative PIN family toxin of toxin-antitoxin system